MLREARGSDGEGDRSKITERGREGDGGEDDKGQGTKSLSTFTFILVLPHPVHSLTHSHPFIVLGNTGQHPHTHTLTM